ncbi:unnamed protein product, partial [Candidula unifasciata]
PKTSSTRTTSAGKGRKQVTPRPFTPRYNSLLEIDQREDISRSALFRQLCALNWILDAMNIEPGYTMRPISRCWSHTEIGGSKISAKRAREERRTESDWERWLNNQLFVKVSKKGSFTRLNRMARGSRLLSQPRVSLQSRSISPSSSSSQVNISFILVFFFLNLCLGIFKFLDEYYDSLRMEEEKQKEAESKPANSQSDVPLQESADDK